MSEWVQLGAGIIGGLTTISGALYLVFRRLKGDSKSDNLDEKSNSIITRLEGQLDQERQRNAAYHEAIERIAKERNEAVQNVGRLEGHVQALETQVQSLRDEIVHLEQENNKLVTMVSEMRTEMASMAENFAKVMASVKQ